MRKFSKEIRDLLEKRGVIIQKHCVLSSGLHTDTFVDMEILFKTDPSFASMLCRLMADAIHEANTSVEHVLGIETGGIFIAEKVATQLKARGTPTTWSYIKKGKRPGSLILTHEDRIGLKKKNIFLVDDVVTSGRSLLRTQRIVSAIGGNVTGIGVLCNRNRSSLEFNTTFFYSSYIEPDAELWTAEQCPLC